MTGGGGLTLEWAQIGKSSEDRGYRVLRCTSGLLTTDNFLEIYNRLSTGTPDKLPQVRIGFGGSDPAAHVVLAIDSQGDTDRDGRAAVLTRLFCIPFGRLAERPTSYWSLFTSLFQCFPQDEKTVTIEPDPLARTGPPVPDAVARNTAALLLNKQPVSVVKAGGVPLQDKIHFIDQVAGYLPYGMRTKFTAASWASGTSEHKVRLTFSQYPRRDGQVVEWERVPKLPRPSHAAVYLDALQGHEETALLRDLAEQTSPLTFAVEDVKEFLDRLYKTGTTLKSRTQALAPGARPQGRMLTPKQFWEALLRDYADAVSAGQNETITFYESRIRANAAHLPEGDGEASCREIIEQSGLLRRDLDDFVARTLLAVAYPRPLTGAAVTHVLRLVDHRPSYGLADALRQLSGPEGHLALAGDDVREQRAQVRGYTERALIKLAREATDLFTIELVARELAARFKKGDPDLARQLSEHSFLALEVHALAPDDGHRQRVVLSDLLKAAYGSSITDSAVFRQALGPHPSETLLAALLMIYRGGPDGRDLALDGYLVGRLLPLGDNDKQLIANLRKPEPGPLPEGGETRILRRKDKKWDTQRYDLTGESKPEADEDEDGGAPSLFKRFLPGSDRNG